MPHILIAAKIFIGLLLTLQAFAHEVRTNSSFKSIPRYPQNITPLSKDYSYFQKQNASTPFWKIMPYFKPQLTNSSCSLAAATLIMNALNPSNEVSAHLSLFTEQKTLDLSDSETWRLSTRPNGPGLTLKTLNMEMQNLLSKLNSTKSYTSEYFEMLTEDHAQLFKHHLKKFNQGQGYIIILYAQGEIMNSDQSYPHFSPVGAYDEEKQRILMLDVDGQWYEPYWLSVDKMIFNITNYDEIMKCQRGYLWISKKS